MDADPNADYAGRYLFMTTGVISQTTHGLYIFITSRELCGISTSSFSLITLHTDKWQNIVPMV